MSVKGNIQDTSGALVEAKKPRSREYFDLMKSGNELLLNHTIINNLLIKSIDRLSQAQQEQSSAILNMMSLHKNADWPKVTQLKACSCNFGLDTY